MCVAQMSFYSSKGMLYYGLPPLVILWILFDIIIVDVHRILVFAALYNALG